MRRPPRRDRASSERRSAGAAESRNTSQIRSSHHHPLPNLLEERGHYRFSPRLPTIGGRHLNAHETNPPLLPDAAFQPPPQQQPQLTEDERAQIGFAKTLGDAFSRALRHNQPARPSVSLFKAFLSHWIPLSFKDPIDQLEAKIDRVCHLFQQEGWTFDQLLSELETISDEAFVRWIRVDMPFQIPGYNVTTATYNDFRAALLNKVDLPLHEVLSMVIFPRPRGKQTSTSFLQQLKRCLIRVGEDHPNETIGMDNLSTLLEEHPEFLPALRKETMLEMTENALLICLNRAAKGRTVPRIAGTNGPESRPNRESTNVQQTAEKGRLQCKFCRRRGHEEANCWKKHSEMRPTGDADVATTRGRDSGLTYGRATLPPSRQNSPPRNQASTSSQHPTGQLLAVVEEMDVGEEAELNVREDIRFPAAAAHPQITNDREETVTVALAMMVALEEMAHSV